MALQNDPLTKAEGNPGRTLSHWSELIVLLAVVVSLGGVVAAHIVGLAVLLLVVGAQ